MARTLRGNLTGRAARSERLHLMEEISEKRLRFQEEWYNALELLKKLDPDWEVWYDARPEQTAGTMLPVIKRRVAEILGAPIEGSDVEKTKSDINIETIADAKLCRRFNTQL